MPDTGHLDALRVRLSHERVYLARAKGISERALRQVWVAQIEREIAAELAFLGLAETDTPAVTDDELLAELRSEPIAKHE